MPRQIGPWKTETTKEIGLDGGRIAEIRPLTIEELMQFTNLPWSAVMDHTVSDEERAQAIAKAATESKEDSEAMLKLVRDVVLAGTVWPRIVDSDEPAGDDEIQYRELGFGRAAVLFREIMRISRMDTEGVAEASEFRIQ